MDLVQIQVLVCLTGKEARDICISNKLADHTIAANSPNILCEARLKIFLDKDHNAVHS